MIRINKNENAPESLSRSNRWNEDDVNVMLLSDQHNKCYLCERKLITDFQVEHFQSQANHPHLAFSWSNLLCSCSYCNGKKSNAFDNILNPLKIDIENLIYQHIDFPRAKALFRIEGDESEEGKSTINLLEKIFNGSGRFRTQREQNLYDYTKSKITSFQGLCLLWLQTGSEESKKAIIEELDITSEFLGFKYWIIKSNPKLLSEFQDHIIWNKKF